MSRFASIKSERGVQRDSAATPAPEAPSTEVRGKAPAREGKRAVSGYFSRDVHRALHGLALEQDLSLQALLGEAIDDLMRKYGRHPFGER